MVNRMRANRGHRDNRRAHHALKDMRVSACPECKNPQIRHLACVTCGKYRGKVIIDVKAVIAKKEAKQKKRNKEAVASGEKTSK